MTRDGTVYVTGYLNSKVRGALSDCFVMRLDHLLDVVYVKSFGDAANGEQCKSIQVTRSNDYIYIGGER